MVNKLIEILDGYLSRNVLVIFLCVETIIYYCLFGPIINVPVFVNVYGLFLFTSRALYAYKLY